MEPNSARDEALADVEKYQAAVAHWEAEKAAAEAELASLQSRAGEEVLMDARAGAQLAKDMQSLRDRIDIASRAVRAAEPKLHAARSAVLEMDAIWWDQEAKRRRARLEKHEAKSAELLNRLQDFDGRVFLPAQVPSNAQYGIPYEVGSDKATPLRDAVRRAELRAVVLRDVAAGRDPMTALRPEMDVRDGRVAGVRPYQLFPPAVAGPEAVVLAPGFVDETQKAKEALVAHDAQALKDAEVLELMRAKLDEHQGRFYNPEADTPEPHWPAYDTFEALEVRVLNAPQRRAEIQRQQSALAASDAAPAAVR